MGLERVPAETMLAPGEYLPFGHAHFPRFNQSHTLSSLQLLCIARISGIMTDS